jgi:hypothetical protein
MELFEMDVGEGALRGAEREAGIHGALVIGTIAACTPLYS